MTLQNARTVDILGFVVICLLSRIIVIVQSNKAVEGETTMHCAES
jgi:hypothetical protein